jgi:hypothetical protein
MMRLRIWGPPVDVDSMAEAEKRSWNAGDTFRLPDGVRYGLLSDHHGGVPFVKGDLKIFLRGG